MSHVFCTVLVSRMHSLFDDIGYWWNHATPNDFGVMALSIVVMAWFVSKYYVD